MGWRLLWFEVLPSPGCLLLSLHWRFPCSLLNWLKGMCYFICSFKRELQGLRNCASPCLQGQETGQWPAAEVRQGASTVAAGCGSSVLRVCQSPWLDGLQTSFPKCRMPTAATWQCPAPQQLTGGAKTIEEDEAQDTWIIFYTTRSGALPPARSWAKQTLLIQFKHQKLN